MKNYDSEEFTISDGKPQPFKDMTDIKHPIISDINRYKSIQDVNQ